MGKRGRFFLTLILLACGAGLLSFYLPPAPGAGVNRDNFDRVRKGMREAEVERIFGCPPGFYNRRPIIVPMSGIMCRRWWVSDEAIITIEFSPDGLDLGTPMRVRHKNYEPLPPETLSKRCQRFLPTWVPDHWSVDDWPDLSWTIADD